LVRLVGPGVLGKMGSGEGIGGIQGKNPGGVKKRGGGRVFSCVLRKGGCKGTATETSSGKKGGLRRSFFTKYS